MLMKLRGILFIWMSTSLLATGQIVQINLPEPAKIAVDTLSSDELKQKWVIRVTADEPHLVAVYSDSNLIAKKRLTLTSGESRIYVMEKDDFGQYGLFYRSGTISGAPIALTTAAPTLYPALPNQPGLPIDTSPSLIQVDSIVTVSVDSLNDTLIVAEGEVKDSTSVEELLDRISEIDYEFERVSTIIEWAENHSPTVEEIEQLSELSAFDPSKLMLVQRLYPTCSNPEEYIQLKDIFQFKEYQNQFETWLKATQEQP